jgi:hypothetical protein
MEQDGASGSRPRGEARGPVPANSQRDVERSCRRGGADEPRPSGARSRPARRAERRSRRDERHEHADEGSGGGGQQRLPDRPSQAPARGPESEELSRAGRAASPSRCQQRDSPDTEQRNASRARCRRGRPTDVVADLMPAAATAASTSATVATQPTPFVAPGLSAGAPPANVAARNGGGSPPQPRPVPWRAVRPVPRPGGRPQRTLVELGEPPVAIDASTRRHRSRRDDQPAGLSCSSRLGARRGRPAAPRQPSRAARSQRRSAVRPGGAVAARPAPPAPARRPSPECRLPPRRRRRTRRPPPGPSPRPASPAANRACGRGREPVRRIRRGTADRGDERAASSRAAGSGATPAGRDEGEHETQDRRPALVGGDGDDCAGNHRDADHREAGVHGTEVWSSG